MTQLLEGKNAVIYGGGGRIGRHLDDGDLFAGEAQESVIIEVGEPVGQIELIGIETDGDLAGVP